MRLDEVGRLLTTENITADMDNYRKLTREHSELEPVVALYRQYQGSLGDLKTAQEMAADPEMREFAEAEVLVVAHGRSTGSLCRQLTRMRPRWRRVAPQCLCAAGAPALTGTTSSTRLSVPLASLNTSVIGTLLSTFSGAFRSISMRW